MSAHRRLGLPSSSLFCLLQHLSIFTCKEVQFTCKMTSTLPYPRQVFFFLPFNFRLVLQVRTNALLYSQKLLGQCINGAPVAFLENFKVTCVTFLQSCPSGPPLQTQPSGLRLQVNDGQGGMFYLPNFVPCSAEI